MLKNILALLLFAGTVAAQDHREITPPQPTQTGDRIEVIEVFWYGCPHCYDFEPHLEKWLETQPQDVEFRRMPGIFNKNWIAHAKAFYTAQALNVFDRIHRPLFDAIHQQRRKLDDERALKAFFQEQGVDGGQFTEVYRSKEVDDQVKQAFLLGQRYKIAGVPSVIINGRYLTSGNDAGSLANVVTVMNRLIDRERALLQNQ
jgi:thiol:disulfide interchange protein DsbA